MTESRIAELWNWFKENEKDLRNFEGDPEKYLDKILSQAKKIQEGLAIELEPPKDDIIGMTISADGDYTLFHTVQKIFEKAPNLEGWKFYAFRQRVPLERVKKFTLNKESKELSVEDIKFFPMIDDDSLDVIIFISGVTDENRNEIAYRGLLLLDNILGEYDCVTKVRHYDFQPMPEDEADKEDLKPLYEIANYVDKFAANKQN